MKTVIIQVAGLGWDLFQQQTLTSFWSSLSPIKAETVFPALTCPVQASFRTALLPEQHGMILNGFFDRNLQKALYWEQSSNLYEGERIWEKFRQNGGKVGQICWQQSLGIDSDMILSPAPIHKHHGGMIQDCFMRPAGYYPKLVKQVGSILNLRHYWGPLTSRKSTEWIIQATHKILNDDENCPELLLVYIPHLDYDQQRYGPHHPKVLKEFIWLEKELKSLYDATQKKGFEFVLFGDYAITEAQQAIFPNKILRDAGFLHPRKIQSAVYLDLWTSPAFALVDHQIAHVFIKNPESIASIQQLLESVSEIRQVYQPSSGHSNLGELIIEAKPGYWFAYPWWGKNEEAPDYATHVDIHNKPGFDPCELFFEKWKPWAICQDTTRIRGTHGNARIEEAAIPLCATQNFVKDCHSLLDLSKKLKNKLSE